jgi:hypothetical protein
MSLLRAKCNEHLGSDLLVLRLFLCFANFRTFVSRVLRLNIPAAFHIPVHRSCHATRLRAFTGAVTLTSFQGRELSTKAQVQRRHRQMRLQNTFLTSNYWSLAQTRRLVHTSEKERETMVIYRIEGVVKVG